MWEIVRTPSRKSAQIRTDVYKGLYTYTYVNKHLPYGFVSAIDSSIAYDYGEAIINYAAEIEGWQEKRVANALYLLETLCKMARKSHYDNEGTQGAQNYCNVAITPLNQFFDNGMGLCRRQVQRYLKDLQNLKIIHKIHEGFNCYTEKGVGAAYVLLLPKSGAKQYVKKQGIFSWSYWIQDVSRAVSKDFGLSEPKRVLEPATDAQNVTLLNIIKEPTQEIFDSYGWSVDFEEKTGDFTYKLRLKVNNVALEDRGEERCKCLENAIRPRFYCVLHKYFSGRRCNPVSGKWKRWSEIKEKLERKEIAMSDIKKPDKYGLMAMELKEQWQYSPEIKDFEYTSPEMVRWICFDFFKARWSVDDITEALEYKPDGAKWYYLREIRSFAGWMRYRLNFWRSATGKPIPSSAQRQAKVNEDKRNIKDIEFSKRTAVWAELGWWEDEEPCTHGYTGVNKDGSLSPILRKWCDLCIGAERSRRNDMKWAKENNWPDDKPLPGIFERAKMLNNNLEK